MNFQWPDPISFIADVVTFIGIPALTYSTYQLVRQVEKTREPQAVSHGCLEFGHADHKTGINLIPLTDIVAIPRPGDTVLLPGEYVDHKNYGGGVYRVESVLFSYIPADPKEVDQPCPALTSKISVSVRKISE